MSAVGQYLVGITSAALICGVLTSLMGKNHPQVSIVRMIFGTFLTLSVISPVKNVQLLDIGDYFDSLQLDAQYHASGGEDAYIEQLREIIKSNTEAYILDKASSMGLTIYVDVEVNHLDSPVPISVVITGTVSSYNKQRLADIIANDLGISEESQTWK